MVTISSQLDDFDDFTRGRATIAALAVSSVPLTRCDSEGPSWKLLLGGTAAAAATALYWRRPVPQQPLAAAPHVATPLRNGHTILQHRLELETEKEYSQRAAGDNASATCTVQEFTSLLNEGFEHWHGCRRSDGDTLEPACIRALGKAVIEQFTARGEDEHTLANAMILRTEKQSGRKFDEGECNDFRNEFPQTFVKQRFMPPSAARDSEGISPKHFQMGMCMLIFGHCDSNKLSRELRDLGATQAEWRKMLAQGIAPRVLPIYPLVLRFFESVDKDGNSKISLTELTAALGGNTAAAADLLDRADKGDKGFLSYDEFVPIYVANAPGQSVPWPKWDFQRRRDFLQQVCRGGY